MIPAPLFQRAELFVLQGIEPVELSIRLSRFRRMPELGIKQIGQRDAVAEGMVKIIAADTDHPFAFPEGRQTFRRKAHPADKHSPCSCCFGTEFPFKDMQIGRLRPLLVPFCSQEFRHFHTDRISSLKITKQRYPRRQVLLKEWREIEGIPPQ